jgi:hypothetical protein
MVGTPTVTQLNNVKQNTVQWSADAHRVTQVSSDGTGISDENPLPVNAINYTGRFTRFDEALTAKRVSQLNMKPTWGISALRYATTETGTGATVGETNGEFRIQSGTTNSNVAEIMTNQRGRYHAGAMGQCGIGIRIPTLPLSTAFCEWGYTDWSNGFYFGVDGTGKYVAYVTGGSVTKVYQTNWNVDKLDGTGVSGKTLDLADGHISHIDFTWYGYGDIEFSYFIKNATTLVMERHVCHRTKIDGSGSIIDPNQPLAFRTGNGASTTTDVSLYIGGHQFSVVDGDSTEQKRVVSELLTNYLTATNTDWQPIIAVRKLATFNGRNNSVNINFDNFLVAATGDMEVRVTVGGTTSNLSWGTPTGRTLAETAVESKVTGGTPLTTSADGEPIEYSYVPANGAGSNKQGVNEGIAPFVLGQTTEIILWIRRLSASGAMTINHAHVTWAGDW